MMINVKKPGFFEKRRFSALFRPWVRIAYWARVVFVLWLAWLLVVIGYQAYVAARLQPQLPDDAVMWTAKETLKDSQKGKPTLLEPFMNAQVAWDSEYYLSIATEGYDDPAIKAIGSGGRQFTLSYAFMPFYPFMIGLASFPLKVFGLNPIATATLAGVLVSAFGALAGMLALYDLARRDRIPARTTGSRASAVSKLEGGLHLDPEGLRAAFYLIAFPTGFWLAQIYTEGLFVGLAFGCLALLRRDRVGCAALLAVFATWTRAVGIALVVPLVMAWVRAGEWLELDLEWRQIWSSGLPWRPLTRALIVLAPVLAFAAWRFSRLGSGFSFVEEQYFGRGMLAFGSTFFAWSNAIQRALSGNPQAAAYYLVEVAGTLLGFAAFFAVRRTHPDVAWFSLLVVFLSFTSGAAQGMHRYVLGAPAVFLALARWGRSPAFDRAWTIASVLLMGVFAALYTYNMWAG